MPLIHFSEETHTPAVKKSNVISVAVGSGLVFILTVLFSLLKMTESASLSWAVVLSPLCAGIIVGLGAIVYASLMKNKMIQ